jgi:hypothetical protein
MPRRKNGISRSRKKRACVTALPTMLSPGTSPPHSTHDLPLTSFVSPPSVEKISAKGLKALDTTTTQEVHTFKVGEKTTVIVVQKAFYTLVQQQERKVLPQDHSECEQATNQIVHDVVDEVVDGMFDEVDGIFDEVVDADAAPEVVDVDAPEVFDVDAPEKQAIRFNNKQVDFSRVGHPSSINEQAFQIGNNKSISTARKAKSRCVQNMVRALETSTKTDAQKSLGIRAFLSHPSVIKHSIAAGFCSSGDVPTAMYQAEQTKKMLTRALSTSHPKGHSNNDKFSFAESILTAAAPSPVSNEKTKAPSLARRSAMLGIPTTTARRLIYRASVKRKRLINQEQGVSWAVTKKRKGYSKITVEIREKLHHWIMNHPHVIDSPISNDTVLILNPDTNLKERVGKLLCEVSIRELHNDLIEEEVNGGLKEARGVSGEVIISDSALRYLLPVQMRPMTERHKQMCGCETCLTIRSHQRTLNSWRTKHLRHLESEAEQMDEGIFKRARLARCLAYRTTILPNGVPWHDKPKNALREIQCSPVGTIGHPKWICVLRRCENCPKYPVPFEETEVASDPAPTINFHMYVPFTKCTKHGDLGDSKTCDACDNLNENEKKGKASTRKHLTLLERTISVFLKDFYFVALEKYAYHEPHVKILSKLECGKMRKNLFETNRGSVKSRRDYAERLSAVFNLEVQSSHFGNGRSLSIEGSSVESYSNGGDSQKMEFHSHFSDFSKQDASSTHAHMTVLLDILKSRGEILPGGLLLDETDGCGKQYRCGTALWCLSVLSSQYGISIDRAIGAPGHGKDIVDGLNATDKRFLRGRMCLIGSPEANDGAKRMAAHSMVEGASKSLALECARLCSDETRITGVKGHSKHKKRESNSKVTLRNYHIQDPAEVKFGNVKFKAHGLSAGTHNGILAMYHLRTDPDLGIGKAALRRIPCLCAACVMQLNLPWQPGILPMAQPRYLTSENCQWWSLFAGLNSWNIVSLLPTKESNPDEIEEAQAIVLDGIGTMMSELVRVGHFGAFMTDDPDADGYYLVNWTSVPYTLQEEIELDEYTPPIRIAKGELVCDAAYWYKVPRAKLWYTRPRPGDATTTIRMRQVIAADMALSPISQTTPLPNSCDKRQATRLGAHRIAHTDHEELLEEIHRRDRLDFDEEEESEDGSGIESASDESSDGEESSNNNLL